MPRTPERQQRRGPKWNEGLSPDGPTPSSLFPLQSVRVQPGEIPEATTNHAVEHAQGCFLWDSRVATHAVEHTCEASAGSQKPQSNLGVFQLTQSVKQVAGFGGPFHCVGVDKAILADGSPQELKVAGNAAASIGVGAEQCIRKMAMEGRDVHATNSNQLRFGKIEAEPNGSGPRFNQPKRSTDGMDVASQDPVIQVVHSNV